MNSLFSASEATALWRYTNLFIIIIIIIIMMRLISIQLARCMELPEGQNSFKIDLAF